MVLSRWQEQCDYRVPDVETQHETEGCERMVSTLPYLEDGISEFEDELYFLPKRATEDQPNSHQTAWRTTKEMPYIHGF